MRTKKTTNVYFAIYEGRYFDIGCEPGLNRIQSIHDKETVGCDESVYVIHCQGSISLLEQTELISRVE
jgi:hypothetical protein